MFASYCFLPHRHSLSSFLHKPHTWDNDAHRHATGSQISWAKLYDYFRTLKNEVKHIFHFFFKGASSKTKLNCTINVYLCLNVNADFDTPPNKGPFITPLQIDYLWVCNNFIKCWQRYKKHSSYADSGSLFGKMKCWTFNHFYIYIYKLVFKFQTVVSMLHINTNLYVCGEKKVTLVYKRKMSKDKYILFTCKEQLLMLPKS